MKANSDGGRLRFLRLRVLKENRLTFLILRADLIPKRKPRSPKRPTDCSAQNQTVVFTDMISETKSCLICKGPQFLKELAKAVKESGVWFLLTVVFRAGLAGRGGTG